MAGENQNKVMTTQEAIRRFVNDGDHVVIGNYTVGTPLEKLSLKDTVRNYFKTRFYVKLTWDFSGSPVVELLLTRWKRNWIK